jgi:hypothetical protein
MDFSEILNSWIISALTQHDLGAVRGFAFNLIEPSSGGFGIELIGTDEFSLEDPDWACAEIFVANPRSINIPDDIHDGTWQSCLEAVKLTLTKLLQSGFKSSSLLQQADGIGVGFVDGDLLIIHPNQSNETQ